MKEQKILFIDANTLLHFKFFDEIKWNELTETENIVLVIPWVVIDDLDKFKNMNQYTARVKKRATNFLKKIQSLLLDSPNYRADIMPGVELRIIEDKPVIDFTGLGLNQQWTDDILIGEILAYKGIKPEQCVLLITADTTLMLRAKQYGIDTFRLPDDLELPEEKDQKDKTIEKLQKEVNELGKSLPKLSLCFADNEKYTRLRVGAPWHIPTNDRDKIIQDIKSQYPKIDLREKENSGASDGVKIGLRIDGEKIKFVNQDIEFNSTMDVFYAEYEEFLKDDIDHFNLIRRTLELELYLKNDGGKPGQDIDVHLYFPNGFELFNSETFPERPVAPEPPKPPTGPFPMIDFKELLTRFDYHPQLAFSSDLLSRLPNLSPPPNISSPLIKKTNSYNVSYQIQNLKHHNKESLGFLYVAFDSFENAMGFRIEYEIIASNMPNKEIGQLDVIIEKADN